MEEKEGKAKMVEKVEMEEEVLMAKMLMDLVLAMEEMVEMVVEVEMVEMEVMEVMEATQV